MSVIRPQRLVLHQSLMGFRVHEVFLEGLEDFFHISEDSAGISRV